MPGCRLRWLHRYLRLQIDSHACLPVGGMAHKCCVPKARAGYSRIWQLPWIWQLVLGQMWMLPPSKNPSVLVWVHGL